MSGDLHSLLVKRNHVGVRKWRIGMSEHGGRGVLANCDIASGELIFVDWPIIYGPKSNCELTACAGCFQNNKPLRGCSKKCRLPFCSNKCENVESHRKECDFLGAINSDEEEWSPSLYRRLTILRGLFMNEDDKAIVELLHANCGKQVDNQIADLQNMLRNRLTHSEIKWLRHCCGVLDGTAFEIEADSSADSLKGLFPLSAVMNHNCVPNTRLTYAPESERYAMLVIASKFIPEGSEILTSYCPLLWATNLRRTFLVHTKQFRCQCERCSDPSEFGTNLQALQCKCGQILLPTQPLNFNSNWHCRGCNETKNAKYSWFLQSNDKSLINVHHPPLPESNYVRVQENIESIFRTTKCDKLKGLENPEIRDVISKCTKVLKLIEQLKLGNTLFKGKLCELLGRIVRELQERGVNYDDDPEINRYCGCGRTINTENEAAYQYLLCGIFVETSDRTRSNIGYCKN